MRNRIFVSIAAYRDAELARTVRDLFSHADRPQALTVAILDQSEHPIARPNCPRGAKVYLDRCHPKDSKGACWARSKLQRRFDGEGFFLQLDAHLVFKRGWDALLLAEFAACEALRPVLTAYLPPYELKRSVPRINGAAATPIHFSHFDQDGVVIYRSHCYTQEIPAPPVPARFFSGHFAFARREFVEKVPYDPELYFYGEESSMAARSFTNGFDLFHPGRTIAWHHYVRQGKPHHWDDHAPRKGTTKSWLDAQRRSLEKYRRIFCLLPYLSALDGLGTRRSLAQYEAWAGVDHYWQLTHPTTVAMHPPPATSTLDWPVEEGFLAEIELHVDLPVLLSIDARPCSQVHVAVIDASPRDGAVRRCTSAEYHALQKTGWTVRVRYRVAPLRLVVWPFIERVGWGRRFEIRLNVPELVSVQPFRRKSPKKSPRRGPAHRLRQPRKQRA